ncbi:MAG: hypothetical protein K6B17_08665 [Treponema sp.]|nr:hypothetical protein [Treponema sp.]
MKKNLITIFVLFVSFAVFAKTKPEPGYYFKIQHQCYDTQETIVSLLNVSTTLRIDPDYSGVGLDEIADDLGITLADAAAMSDDKLNEFKEYYYAKRSHCGWFFAEFTTLGASFNYELRNTQVELGKMKIGANIFDTDRIISVETWRNCSTKFYVPMYVEFNLFSMLFDDKRYFYNPEINFGIDFNLVAFKNINFGLSAMEKISIRNMAKELISGKDSIIHGLRGNVPSHKFCVSVFVRLWSMYGEPDPNYKK